MAHPRHPYPDAISPDSRLHPEPPTIPDVPLPVPPILVLIMVTATLLTMAERKWSALMQDRVGPNRARLPIPGLSERPLKGIPHILADVLKMLFKEDFVPEGADRNKFLFNLAPLLAFAPAFCLFAVVPVGPEITFWG